MHTEMLKTMKTFNTILLSLLLTGIMGCKKGTAILPENQETTLSNATAVALAAAPVATVTVKVTTYNILSKDYDATFPNNMWVGRKDAVGNIIHQSNNVPEILGIQEGQNLAQVNDVVSRMGSGYDNYVSNRNISARAIFWKNDKYELVASDTKELLSAAVSGYTSQRYASYVRLRHIATGKMLIVFNVHLPAGADAVTAQIRFDMATNLAGKVQQFSSDYGNIPVIVMGDFNSYYNTVINGLISAPAWLTSLGLSDTYAACPSASRLNPNYETKNDMVNAKAKSAANGSKRLDYIFTYPAANITVLDWRNIINFVSGSTVNLVTPVPSDHNPVRSRLTLNWY